MAEDAIREAVGLFHDEKQLQSAIDELLISGFDYADFSLLAPHSTVESKLGHLYEKVADLEDDPQVALKAYVDVDTRTEGKGALMGGLIYVGAVATAGLIVASGGTMAALILGGVVGGGAGGLVGHYMGRYFDRNHTRYLQEHLDKGGLLLWVHTADEAHERKAVEVLKRNGAEDAHVHSLPKPDLDKLKGVSKDLSFMNMLGM